MKKISLLFFCRSKSFSITIYFCCNSVLIKEFENLSSGKNKIWDFNKISELFSATNMSLQLTCCFRLFISFLSLSIIQYALIATNCIWLFWNKSLEKSAVLFLAIVGVPTEKLWPISLSVSSQNVLKISSEYKYLKICS